MSEAFFCRVIQDPKEITRGATGEEAVKLDHLVNNLKRMMRLSHFDRKALSLVINADILERQASGDRADENLQDVRAARQQLTDVRFKKSHIKKCVMECLDKKQPHSECAPQSVDVEHRGLAKAINVLSARFVKVFAGSARPRPVTRADVIGSWCLSVEANNEDVRQAVVACAQAVYVLAPSSEMKNEAKGILVELDGSFPTEEVRTKPGRALSFG
jgi:hypothetical protein